MPTKLEISAAYQGYSRVAEETANESEYTSDRFIVDLLTSLFRAGGTTVLDIGCSTGGFLETAKTTGWKGTGIEIDAAAATLTANRLNLDVKVGDALDLLPSLGRFDLVAASHTLEHVVSPGQLFAEIGRHVNPGGHILARVPNSRSRAAILLRKRWNWYRPPVHLSYFSERSFEVAAARARLKIRSVTTRRGPAHLFPTELLLATARIVSGEAAYQDTVKGNAGPTVVSSRFLSWVDRRMLAQGYFGKHDDSELAVLLENAGEK